jgi:hypothetical protein
MKSDQSIRNIAIASIRRHSGDFNEWKGTNISVSHFPPQVIAMEGELPVVFFKADDDNWTLMTTRRIIGSINGERNEIKFEESFITLWGNYKKNAENPIDTTYFRILGAGARQLEFLMETGNPAIAFVYGIKTVEGFYRAKAA